MVAVDYNTLNKSMNPGKNCQLIKAEWIIELESYYFIIPNMVIDSGKDDGWMLKLLNETSFWNSII